MRVEAAEHALDGVLQQGGVVHLFDIAEAYLAEDVGKGAQLVKRQNAGLAAVHGIATVGIGQEGIVFLGVRGPQREAAQAQEGE